MRKRDEILLPDSCLNQAGDDELIFVLRASDPAAWVAVQAWIGERLRIGRNTYMDEKIFSAENWIDDAVASLQENYDLTAKRRRNVRPAT